MNIQGIPNEAPNPLQTRDVNPLQPARDTPEPPDREVNRTAEGDTYTPTDDAGGGGINEPRTNEVNEQQNNAALPSPNPVREPESPVREIPTEIDLANEGRQERVIEEANQRDQITATRTANEGPQNNPILDIMA